MSNKHCKQCEQPLKLKHLVRAEENNHHPPDLCYPCLCKKQGRKTSRERKVELAKRRARKREAAQKGLSGDG